MPFEFWVTAAVLLIASTAAAVVFRAYSKPLPKMLGFFSAAAVVLSCCVFDYMWVVAMRVSGLPMAERINALMPWAQAGSFLALVALIASAFTVKWARLTLVILSSAMTILWLGASAGV